MPVTVADRLDALKRRLAPLVARKRMEAGHLRGAERALLTLVKAQGASAAMTTECRVYMEECRQRSIGLAAVTAEIDALLAKEPKALQAGITVGDIL